MGDEQLSEQVIMKALMRFCRHSTQAIHHLHLS